MVPQISNDGWEGGEASTGSTRASRVIFSVLAEDRRFRPFTQFSTRASKTTRDGACAPQDFWTRAGFAKLNFTEHYAGAPMAPGIGPGPSGRSSSAALATGFF